MSFAILPRRAGRVLQVSSLAVHRFEGGEWSLASPGTFFAVVLSGRPCINGIQTRPGMYACLPRIMACEGADDSLIMIVEVATWGGIFTLAGPIEPIGRLRYIDGCTDTGLIGPPRLGDPCLNALFFPAGTQQTPHRHPSHRIGAIYDGAGWCLTEDGPTPMRKGDLFIIPEGALHWFRTDDEAMRIAVFHPDSEFGPSDDQHQMLNATVIAQASA